MAGRQPMEEGKGEERLARASDHPAAAGGGHIKRPLGTSIDRLPGEPTAELKARTSIRFPIDWRTFDQLKVFVDVDPVGKKHKIVSVEPSTRNNETIISQEVGRIADLLCAIRYFAITHFRISTDIDTRFFQLLQIGDTQCLSSTYSDLVQQKDGVRRKNRGPVQVEEYLGLCPNGVQCHIQYVKPIRRIPTPTPSMAL